MAYSNSHTRISNYLKTKIIARTIRLLEHFPLVLSICEITDIEHTYTQRDRALDAQQLRVVLMRCGGSEKKRRSRLSEAYGLGTL